jgi:hypothetical protein
MTPPVNADISGGDAGRGAYSGSPLLSDSVWSSRTQWGAIIAGAFAGIGVVMVMATLGAALGITAGAVGVSTTQTVNPNTAEKAATAFTIGAAIWVLLTALATGLVGGWVLNSTARRDRPYSSLIFGGVAWAVGTCVMLAVAAPAIGGAVSGLGSGAGVAAGTAMSAQPDGFPQMTPRTTKAAPEATPSARGEATPDRPRLAMTDEEKVLAKDAAEKAAAAATGAAWVLLGSQLISLAATIFAAGWNRHTGARVVTEIRPRPAPMT